MKKVILSRIIAVILIMSSFTTVYASTKDGKWSVIVNGNYSSVETPVVGYVEGSTLVPVRQVIEGLGGSIEWNNSTQSILVKYGGEQWEYFVGKYFLKHNDEQIQIPYKTQLINGTSYIPIDQFAKHHEIVVSKNFSSNVISITGGFTISEVLQDESFTEENVKDVDIIKLEQLVKSTAQRNKVIYKELDFLDTTSIQDMLDDIYNVDRTFEETLSEKGEVNSLFGNLANPVLIQKYTRHKLILNNSDIKATFEPAAYYQLKLDINVVGGVIKYEGLDTIDTEEYYKSYVYNFQETTGELMKPEIKAGIKRVINETVEECKKDNGKFKIFMLENGTLQQIY